jgi:hypothetical protein
VSSQVPLADAATTIGALHGIITGGVLSEVTRNTVSTNRTSQTEVADFDLGGVSLF